MRKIRYVVSKEVRQKKMPHLKLVILILLISNCIHFVDCYFEKQKIQEQIEKNIKSIEEAALILQNMDVILNDHLQ